MPTSARRPSSGVKPSQPRCLAVAKSVVSNWASRTSVAAGRTAKGGKLRKAGDKSKNLGNEVAYRPETPITWDVRPIVNE